MSIASFCISSLEPLQVETWSVAKTCGLFPQYTLVEGGGVRRTERSHQYCALSPTWSLWYVRPWMVLYSRMLEVIESVELAVSPKAESLSSSRSCCA